MLTVVGPIPAAAARPLPNHVLMQALDASRAAMVLCDLRLPGSPVVYANPAFIELTGFTLDQVLGRSCAFLHGPETDADVCADIRRAIVQGKKLTTVVRSYRRDGSPFWNRLSLAPIVDEHGALTHYVGMQEDVGECKDASLQMQILRCDQDPGLASRQWLESELPKALAENQFRREASAMLQSGRIFQQAAQVQQSARHLLLLDDEPNILRSLRRVFRAQPWTVHIANMPDEAFELLGRHPVGVVMSDQRMPLMRGTDFLARVKQIYPDTVRIVLSGYTELQSVTEAINEGAIYKFLTKPWNDVQLNEEIEQAFRQYEMVAESQLLQQRLRDINKLLESRLQQNEERLQREEVALDVTHEALGVVPVPILGVDASGMIAISNAAADMLLGGGASVVGEHVNDVLPLDGLSGSFADACNDLRLVQIGDVMYEVRCNGLGALSRGTGTVITLLQGARS